MQLTAIIIVKTKENQIDHVYLNQVSPKIFLNVYQFKFILQLFCTCLKLGAVSELYCVNTSSFTLFLILQNSDIACR